MLVDAMQFVTKSFAGAVSILDAIVAAVGAHWFIVTSVSVVFVVSMFLLPLRGAAVSSFADASLNHIKSSRKVNYKRGDNHPAGRTKRLKGK